MLARSVPRSLLCTNTPPFNGYPGVKLVNLGMSWPGYSTFRSALLCRNFRKPEKQPVQTFSTRFCDPRFATRIRHMPERRGQPAQSGLNAIRQPPLTLVEVVTGSCDAGHLFPNSGQEIFLRSESVATSTLCMADSRARCFAEIRTARQ